MIVYSLSSFHSREYLIPESNAGDNSGLLFIIAVANAAIFIVIVIVMTVVLVLLFKYRCYKVGVASLLKVGVASLLIVGVASLNMYGIDSYVFSHSGYICVAARGLCTAALCDSRRLLRVSCVSYVWVCGCVGVSCVWVYGTSIVPSTMYLRVPFFDLSVAFKNSL